MNMPTSVIKPLRQTSLSFRLLATAAVVLTFISGALVLTIALLLHWGPEALVTHELERNARHAIDGLHYDSAGTPDRIKLNYKMQTVYDVLKSDAVYRILDRQGGILLSSDHADSAYVADGQLFDPERTRLRLVRKGEALQVLTKPFTHGGQQFYVQIMRSERMHRVLLGSDGERTQKIAIAGALIAMFLFSLIVVATLHYVLKPLRNAAAAAAKIQLDNLATRLPVAGIPSELVPLFNAFNLALQRLDDGYRVQREFLATAAHELKTPLALIRGQVELDEPGDRAGLLRDLDHMARQVHQLLHLAELSERQNYAIETLDANEVAVEAAAQLERLAQRRDVRVVNAGHDEAIIINADRGALFVLMRNLIENAIHHAPAGSAVDVAVSRQGISVRDYGIGISADAMPQLFKRFWRGAHRRDEGAGLGLSICEEIAHAHGWTLQAGNVHPGARFTVTFEAPAE